MVTSNTGGGVRQVGPESVGVTDARLEKGGVGWGVGWGMGGGGGGGVAVQPGVEDEYGKIRPNVPGGV